MFTFQRDVKERIQQQKSTQNRLREQRQQIARAKKYHNDYHVQHRARLMRARTKEERVSSNNFVHQLQDQLIANIIYLFFFFSCYTKSSVHNLNGLHQ